MKESLYETLTTYGILFCLLILVSFVMPDVWQWVADARLFLMGFFVLVTGASYWRKRKKLK